MFGIAGGLPGEASCAADSRARVKSGLLAMNFQLATSAYFRRRSANDRSSSPARSETAQNVMPPCVQ